MPYSISQFRRAFFLFWLISSYWRALVPILYFINARHVQNIYTAIQRCSCVYVRSRVHLIASRARSSTACARSACSLERRALFPTSPPYRGQRPSLLLYYSSTYWRCLPVYARFTFAVAGNLVLYPLRYCYVYAMIFTLGCYVPHVAIHVG